MVTGQWDVLVCDGLSGSSTHSAAAELGRSTEQLNSLKRKINCEIISGFACSRGKDHGVDDIFDGERTDCSQT